MANTDSLIIEVGADLSEIKEAMKQVKTILNEGASQAKAAGSKSAAGFSNGFKNGLKGLTNSLQGISGLLGGAFASDKVLDFGKDTVQTAAEVAALQSQFESTFGNVKSEAEKSMGAVADATGIIPERLMEQYTKAYSQMKGANNRLGKAAKPANAILEDTSKVTKLAADAAAYYNIPLEDATSRILSFMRGNMEAGDAIGLFSSEAQRNSASMTMYGKTWDKLNEAERQNLQLDTIGKLYEGNGVLGQANKEAGAYENTMANLKETWKQFMATIGTPILEALIPIFQKIGEGVKWWTDQLKAGNPWVTAITILVGAFVAILAILIPILGGVAIAMGIVETVGAPIILTVLAIVAAIAALVAIGVVVYKNWDKISKWLKDTWEKIKKVAVSAWEGIKKAIVEPVEKAVDDVIGFFEDLWGTVKGIWDKITGFFSWLGGKKATVSVNSSVEGGDTQKHAAGGIFTGYSKIGNDVFGEAGHEAVIPLSAKGLKPFAEALRKEGAAGVLITGNNFYVRNDGDIKRIAYELKRLTDTDSRNKGYGYGY